jgi:hypothetical protein
MIVDQRAGYSPLSFAGSIVIVLACLVAKIGNLVLKNEEMPSGIDKSARNFMKLDTAIDVDSNGI